MNAFRLGRLNIRQMPFFLGLTLSLFLALNAEADGVYGSWMLLYGDENSGLFIKIERTQVSSGPAKYDHHYKFLYRNTSKMTIKGDVIVDLLYGGGKKPILNLKRAVEVKPGEDNKRYQGDWESGPNDVIVKSFNLAGSSDKKNPADPRFTDHTGDSNWRKVTHSDGTVEWVPLTITYPGPKNDRK